MPQGVRARRESAAYQLILEEGAVDALQKTLLRLGQQRFGKPSKVTEEAIRGITDLPRLERMTDRVLSSKNWQDLLATP